MTTYLAAMFWNRACLKLVRDYCDALDEILRTHELSEDDAQKLSYVIDEFLPYVERTKGLRHDERGVDTLLAGFRDDVCAVKEVSELVRNGDLGWYTGADRKHGCAFLKHLQFRTVSRIVQTRKASGAGAPANAPAEQLQPEQSYALDTDDVGDMMATLCLLADSVDHIPPKVVRAMEESIGRIVDRFGHRDASELESFHELKDEARTVLAMEQLSPDEISGLVDFMQMMLRHPQSPLWVLVPEGFHVFVDKFIKLMDSQQGREQIREEWQPKIREMLGEEAWKVAQDAAARDDELNAKGQQGSADDRKQQMAAANVLLELFVDLMDRNKGTITKFVTDPGVAVEEYLPTGVGAVMTNE